MNKSWIGCMPGYYNRTHGWRLGINLYIFSGETKGGSGGSLELPSLSTVFKYPVKIVGYFENEIQSTK